MKYTNILVKDESKANKDLFINNYYVKDNGFEIYVDFKNERYLSILGTSIINLGLKHVNISFDKKLQLDEYDLFALQKALISYKNTVSFKIDDKYRIKNFDENLYQSLVGHYIFLRALSDLPNIAPEVLVEDIIRYIETKNKEYDNKIKYTLHKYSDPDFAKKFVGLCTVGGSSSNKPCMLELEINCKKNQKANIALVGKGIVFDTGGYDLKPLNYMSSMRTDKSGAICALGVILLAQSHNLKQSIRVYLPFAQNMINDKAMVPGDIIRYPNNVTVEIIDTDAEGRLILADGLIMASKHAKRVIDIATLTGAAKVALGRDMCALFAPNNNLDLNLLKAFEKHHELCWQLPLNKDHKEYCQSQRADLINSSKGTNPPGASVAAAFLNSFVPEDVPYVHIDFANAFMVDANKYANAGPTLNVMLPLVSYIKSLK